MKRLPTDLSTKAKSLRDRGFSCIRAALVVPLDTLFDYLPPKDAEVRVGDRVVVPFGARQRIGVVIETNVASELPAARLKPVIAVRDDAPPLSAAWLAFMKFLAG